MPIQDIKGLKGLRGWNDLSSAEQAAWLELHPKYNGVDDVKMISGYANQNFIDEFGRENFDRYDRQTRDLIYKNKIVGDTVKDTFKDDYNLDTILQMTPDAQLELLDSDYLDKQEKADRRRENLNKGITKDTKGFEVSDLIDPLGIGRAAARKAGEFQANITEKSKDNILADINARDLYRKKDSVSGKSEQIGLSFTTGLQTGKINEDQVNEVFSKIADGSTETYRSNLGEVTYENPGSRVYKAYKDSHEMSDFGLQDKITTIAEYEAMKESYGTLAAQQYLDTKMQDYIAEHQNVGDWLGAAGAGAATKFAANVMGIKLFLDSMALSGDPQALANWAEGKDKEGNPLPIWNNPQYWNGVDQFGSFSPEYINKVREENGGISKYNWLTPVGQEMNFSNTINEALKMSGYMLAGTLVSRGIGLGTSGLSTLAGKAGATAVQGAIETAAPYLIGAVNAMGISEAYAMGTYDQVLQEASEKIDNKRYADAQKYAEQVMQTSGETQGLLDEYVRRRTEEILNQNPDLRLEDINEQALYDEAAMQYSAALQQQYLTEHDSDYDADRDMARRAGATAYTTDASLEFLRMTLSNLTYRKWMMSKANRDKLSEVFPNRKAVQVGDKLVAKTANGRSLAWGDVTPVLRNIWGGARDNYLDDVTVAFAKGFGLDKFNNYFESELSPKEYAASTDLWTEFLSGVAAGATDAELSMIDRQSFHDGLVGGLGGAVTIAPRFARIAQRSAWQGYANYDKADLIRAASERRMPLDVYLSNKEIVNADIKDGKVRELNWAEKANEWVFNPLLQDYSDARQRSRDFQYAVDEANKVIADNLPKLNKIVTSASLLNESLLAEKEGNLADLKDIQAKQAFAYIADLEDMGNDPIYSQSTQVQQQIAEMERIAKGQITEQDIKNFLEDLDNKSVKEDPNAVQIATERLQKNAEKLVKMREAYKDAMDVLKKSSDFQAIAHLGAAKNVAMQLSFDKVMYANREERIAEMEKELRNVSQVSTTSNPIALYGSEKGRQEIEAVQQKIIEERTANIKSIEADIERVKNAKARGEQRVQKEYRLQALNLELDEAKMELSDARAKLQDIQAAKDVDFSRILSEDEILALNPVERAEMLSDKPRGLYTPAQRKVIDKVIRNLKMRDSSLLDSIQDSATLTQRNEALVKSNSIMQDNLLAAANYYDHAQNERRYGIQEVWNQRLRERVDNALQFIPLSHSDVMLREAKKFNNSVLSDFVKRHPGFKDALTPALEITKFRDEASDTLDRLFDGDLAKINSMRNTVNALINSPRMKTPAQVMSALEDIVDQNTGTPQEVDWNNFLSKLQEVNYLRDATKVQQRTDKKKAEKEASKPQPEPAPVSPAAQANTAQVEKTETADVHHADDAQSGAGIPIFQQSLTAEKGFTDDGSVNEPTAEEVVEMATKDNRVTVVEPSEVAPEEASNNVDSGLDGAMLGNVLFEYDGKPLIQSGITYNDFINKNLRIAERKVPFNKGNALDAYYQWEDSTNTDVQAIIDNELSDIIDENPDTFIYFVKLKNNGIQGIDTVIFNAIEYTDAVKKHHNEDFGKPIIIGEKQYLIIGTLGFNKNYEGMEESFNTIMNSFNGEIVNNGDYYLSPYTTKFDDIYSGVLVDNYGREGVGQLRTIESLLKDEKTNPHGITYDNAVWGLMRTKRGFIQFGQGKPGKLVLPPTRVETTGLIYLMVPSSNGNYIPIALEPAHISDLNKNSSLRQDIEENIRNLTHETKWIREEALQKLSDYLVFTKGVQEIKFSDNSHTDITVVKDAGIQMTYRLDDPNTVDNLRYEVMQATPFRVNISPKVLLDKSMLQRYDESGALRTTAAKLGTVNASYTVFRVDSNGNVIERAQTPAPVPQSAKPEASGTKVHYLGGEYTIAPDKQVYDMNGKVLNEKSAFAVRAFNYIITQNLSPEYTTDKGDSYYRINKNTVVLWEENGKIRQIEGDNLTKYNIRLEQKRKDDAAKEAVKEKGNLGDKKLFVVSDNTDKSYNFTKEMRKADSATFRAVDEFLTKKGIKNVDDLTNNQKKEELIKHKVSLDTVTDEKSFIDMLNNCL